MKVISPQPLKQTDGFASKSMENEKNTERARFVIGFLGDLDVEDMEENESGGIITSRTIWAARSRAAGNGAEDQFRVDDAAGGDGGRRDSGTPPPRKANLEEFRIIVYTVGIRVIHSTCVRDLAKGTSIEPPFYSCFHI
jgi:hypothetical protein